MNNETSDKPEGGVDLKGVYSRLFEYLKPHRRMFFMALGAMVVYGCTDGAVPLLISAVLDDIFGARDENMLIMLPIAVVVFAVIRGVFGFIQKYLAAKVGLAIVKDIRNEINSHFLRLSPAFFSRHQSGSLISRVTNDTLLVRTTLTDAAAAILRDTVRVIVLLCVAVYLDPMLALIACIGFPLGLYPIILFGKRVRRLSRIGQNQFGGLTSILHETLAGYKVVQSFVREDFEQKRFEKENDKFTRTLRKAEKYGALAGPTNEFTASIAIAAVILYGGLSVISGVRTQGDFIAFLMAMFLLYEPVKKLSRVNTIVQNGAAAAERIFEVIDTKPEVTDKPDAIELQSNQHAISFDQVWFEYPKIKENENGEDETWALREICLTLPPGQTLALVGSSGGGKSTLINLLPRFYDPQRGSIRIDGVDLRDLRLASLRSAIALVDQHTFLFNDSVLNNIRYGRIDATDDEVMDAARSAYAHDFIMRFAEGYDSIIGEQGFRLSGGERARIAIARALLKNAPILVLDEATAALDSESEKIVQVAIERLMRGRTVIVIAHRLATVRNADVVAVLSKGKIVELGSHDELLAQDGEFTKLHNIQFQSDQGDQSHQGSESHKAINS